MKHFHNSKTKLISKLPKKGKRGDPSCSNHLSIQTKIHVLPKCMILTNIVYSTWSKSVWSASASVDFSSLFRKYKSDNLHQLSYIGNGSDPCSFAPCLNGGTCYSNGNSSSCICPDGYYGEHCEYHQGKFASQSWFDKFSIEYFWNGTLQIPFQLILMKIYLTFETFSKFKYELSF